MKKKNSFKNVAKIICPHCGKRIVAYRGFGGRIVVTSVAGVGLAIAGGVFGGSIGIATGGWGIPATVPLAVTGFVVGSGLGYIVSDKALDKPKCPSCKKPINLRFR